MPPVTRRQSKKVEPYSKENHQTEKRLALSNINKDFKRVSNRSKSCDVKKSNNVVFKVDNNAKTDKTETVITKKRNEILKLSVPAEPETRSITREVTRLSLNTTNGSSLYESTREYVKSPEESEKSFVIADAIQSDVPIENSHSELYLSAIESNNDCANNDEVFEIDQINWYDFWYMGCYARDIFKYLRQREDTIVVTDYINDQSELTPRHRAVVVNWLVNLQETFELNHEVLYMAVRLIDLYLMKNETPKNKFQLLASGALLLSSKIDERELGFPNILVKQSNYTFTEEELLVTERELAKSLNFDINVPLSYVFLRRFARIMKCQMILLTLARYILEFSLLDYKFVTIKESLKASAALYLAFKMFSMTVDGKDFSKYTGYSINDIKSTVIELNNLLHTQMPDLNSVQKKYSHKIFFKVANKPILNNSKLSFD